MYRGFQVGWPSQLYACVRFENLTRCFLRANVRDRKNWRVTAQNCRVIVRMCGLDSDFVGQPTWKPLYRARAIINAWRACAQGVAHPVCASAVSRHFSHCSWADAEKSHRGCLMPWQLAVDLYMYTQRSREDWHVNITSTHSAVCEMFLIRAHCIVHTRWVTDATYVP